MKIHSPAISIALLLVPIASFAAEPPASTTSTVPAAVAVAQTPKAPVAVASDSAAIAKAAHSMGYKTRQRDGKTVYCKTDTSVGTSFRSTTCLTEDEVTAAVKRSEGNKDSIEALQRAWLAGAASKEPLTPMGSMHSQ
jgi:hypothetical protein